MAGDDGGPALDGSVPEEPMLDCPACRETFEHAVLRAATAGWTVECLNCHAVRTVDAPAQERMVEVPAILSEGAQARTVRLHVPLDGPVAVDDEYDLEGH